MSASPSHQTPVNKHQFPFTEMSFIIPSFLTTNSSHFVMKRKYSIHYSNRRWCIWVENGVRLDRQIAALFNSCTKLQC